MKVLRTPDERFADLEGPGADPPRPPGQSSMPYFRISR